MAVRLNFDSYFLYLKILYQFWMFVLDRFLKKDYYTYCNNKNKLVH